MSKLKKHKPTVLDCGVQSWDEGYAAGLRDGARRERMALRRWINMNCCRGSDGEILSGDVAKIIEWFTARQKKEHKK